MRHAFKKHLWLVMAFSLAILASCSKSSTNNQDKEGGQVQFDGLWFGSFILQPAQQMHLTFAMIDPQGEAFFGVYDTTYFDFSVSLHGTLKEQDENIKGNLDVLTVDGKTGNQLQVYNGKIVRTQFEGNDVRGLVAKFTGNAQVFDGSGDLSLAANDPVYETASSLSAVSGTWTLVEEDGITTIVVGSQGNISGGTNWGATFAGTLELINTQKNLYRIKTFTIAGADQPYDGQYHGLASIIDETLIVSCVKDDGSFMWSDGFTRSQ